MSFPFKSSRYDFDQILEKRGFTISIDYEDKVVFSKQIKINSEHASRFREEELKALVVNVTRPKILDKANNYEICSPYAISFNYFVVPHHAIRRVRWDTFPGHIPDVFETMLGLAEDEATICANTFMETDAIIIDSYAKNNKTETSDKQ